MSNNNTTKQIPFSLEAFGPDGMLKEGYEVRQEGLPPLLYVRFFANPSEAYITVVFNDGSCGRYTINAFKERFKIYRRTRTAEDIARGLIADNYPGSGVWDGLPATYTAFYVKCVQAGMDEMREP